MKIQFFSFTDFGGDIHGICCEDCALEHFRNDKTIVELTNEGDFHKCDICNFTGRIGQEYEDLEYQQDHPMIGDSL